MYLRKPLRCGLFWKNLRGGVVSEVFYFARDPFELI